MHSIDSVRIGIGAVVVRMHCRQLRKKFGRLTGVAVIAGLLWRFSSHHDANPSPVERVESLPVDHDEVSAAKKPLQPRPIHVPAKKLFVEQDVTCASGSSPTEGRVHHLAASNVTAQECVERCRVEDECAIFTWVFETDGGGGRGSCWYRIGGRKGAWLARHAAANAVSGCSVEAVVGCDPEAPYKLKEVLHASDVARADTPDGDVLVHPSCPEPFRKRWTAGSIALMLELLDQLHTELEELHVPYSLFGAALLGQMRHAGFIPWQVGQAQIAIRHSDVGAVRHQLEPEIASKSVVTSAGRLRSQTKGKRPWVVTDKKTGFRLKFAEIDGKLNDLHRSFFVDVYVVGGGDAFTVQGSPDLLLPESVQLAPFHSRMYRVSKHKWEMLKMSGITQ